MEYPIRKSGIVCLEANHFGIKQKKYLYALSEWVKGSSIDEIASAVSKKVGKDVTEIMIKETFKKNLFQELSNFEGDSCRKSFYQFCKDNGVKEDILQENDKKFNQRKNILAICYLREVFDIRPPIFIKEE